MISVSIVIPAFNPGDYLHVALQSVCAQSFADWEAIVVDDGSPQDISWVTSVDPRIRYLRQQNRGQAVARNSGIEVAVSKYVAFLDQDDVWLPEKLQAQVAMLEAHTDWVACHTQFTIVDGEGRKSYCQMSWMAAESQAASFVPSLKITPAMTSGSNTRPLSFRHRF